ncbi:MAG: hypothetical protein JO352_26015 [Chloroflexi bacterium]|nr:hypothetical protein [Chloroflexota bacterium]MBV9599513.1 hypothetical protein [Chloroflexota bacterium]
MRTAATSVQGTSLDVVWICDRVACLGFGAGDRCYRGALAVEGPSEAFAQEMERVQPALEGFAGFVNAFGQSSIGAPAAIQILVRAEPGNMLDYAARLEARAKHVPEVFAKHLLADAGWARQKGGDFGLLPRRGYVVVPAESLTGSDVAGRLQTARSRFGRWFRGEPGLDETAAREILEVRCSELGECLARAGVFAQRMDDPALTHLFQTCWSRRGDKRFEQDLRLCAPSGWSGRG